MAGGGDTGVTNWTDPLARNTSAVDCLALSHCWPQAVVAGGNALCCTSSRILVRRFSMLVGILRGGAVSESIHQSFLRHIHSMLQIADKDNKGFWLLSINLP